MVPVQSVMGSGLARQSTGWLVREPVMCWLRSKCVHVDMTWQAKLVCTGSNAYITAWDQSFNTHVHQTLDRQSTMSSSSWSSSVWYYYLELPVCQAWPAEYAVSMKVKQQPESWLRSVADICPSRLSRNAHTVKVVALLSRWNCVMVLGMSTVQCESVNHQEYLWTLTPVPLLANLQTVH